MRVSSELIRDVFLIRPCPVYEQSRRRFGFVFAIQQWTVWQNIADYKHEQWACRAFRKQWAGLKSLLSTVIVVVAIIAIVAIVAIVLSSRGSWCASCRSRLGGCSTSCSISCRSGGGGRALAVSDDVLDPGQEALHPRVHTLAVPSMPYCSVLALVYYWDFVCIAPYLQLNASPVH